ncbi:Fes1-domain-containing protein [Dothidotthia symphoricarpi CBS 119687]|uniref:Fes1-domain-containing protein n=1 Tax=Dothidotthia symphoricarpi CBS 119687 TaxID=1392245 RepID=A0A6A6ACV5_9PLEO|nr:Fes1-domain-containing protein [Dothidotthia symphoricarpi CBS 119687]KAF2128814.1 Fes1-domain-containing protein [Dothidotthia symphoricarpi CBS 119687]
MNDSNMNSLLKWGVENSKVSNGADAKTQLNQEALAALFGGNQKSDAQMMKEMMEVVQDEEAKLENRIVAFDNFEQLIENLDNANNIESLKLWTPLVEQLENKNAELRTFAAWCCATAVSNNIRTQERLLIVGAIPILVRMAIEDTDKKARKKAILALSSSVRNFQAGLDEAVSHMPAEFKPQEKLDANDMDSVDVLINKLRESV